MSGVSIPTGSQLPAHLHVDCSNRTVQKSLSRLSRSALISLALSWAGPHSSSLTAPLLLRDHLRQKSGGQDVDTDDEEEHELEFLDDPFTPARSLDQLYDLYAAMLQRKGPKSEVLGRITECDWKHGITLYQLAMADFRHLSEAPHSLRWSAYRIVPLRAQSGDDAREEGHTEVDPASDALPVFHPTAFLRNLQAQILPDVKVHYCFDRHETLPLMLLRILVLESPYNTRLAFQGATGKTANFDASRAIYLGFPDSSPYVYVSRTQTNVLFQAGEAKTLLHAVVEGIPKALSQPRERFALRYTDLSTKNLAELVERRGPGRTNHAAGGWSFYADKTQHLSPLVTTLPPKPARVEQDALSQRQWSSSSRKRGASPATERDERRAKRARLVAQARFENTAKMDDGKGVERVDVAIRDPFPEVRGLDEEDLAPADDEDEAARRHVGVGARKRKSILDTVLQRDGEVDPSEEDADGDRSHAHAWRPNVKLTFHGPHVFAGLRQLVEHGIVDGERMPGWMTGQEGVTMGVVRHGRIRGSRD